MSLETWVVTGGSIVVALIGAWALVAVNRGTRKAERESKQATSETDLEAARIRDREQLVTQQREALAQQGEQMARLWARQDALEAAADEDRERAARDHERIASLEAENGDLRHHTVVCAENVQALTQRINDYARRYGVAVRYVRRLHDWMAENLPGDLRPPEPPEGLAFDLADPMHADDEPPPDGWPPRAVGPSRTLGP